VVKKPQCCGWSGGGIQSAILEEQSHKQHRSDRSRSTNCDDDGSQAGLRWRERAPSSDSRRESVKDYTEDAGFKDASLTTRTSR
jgi:hypothetical protein